MGQHGKRLSLGWNRKRLETGACDSRNHVKQGIIRTYNRHGYDKEKQQALETWERKLKSIITATESKVIPIRRNSP
jgi:hypothetical protein